VLGSGTGASEPVLEDVTRPCAEVVPLLEVEGASRKLLGRLNVAESFPPRLIELGETELNVAVTVEFEGPPTVPLRKPVNDMTGASVPNVVEP